MIIMQLNGEHGQLPSQHKRPQGAIRYSPLHPVPEMIQLGYWLESIISRVTQWKLPCLKGTLN